MKRSRIAGRSQQLWCHAGHVVAFIALVLNGCGPGDPGGQNETMSLGLSNRPTVCMGEPDIVCTQSGPVQGVLEESHRAFLGIPYAAPPVGDLRWAPPEAPEGWTDVLDASEFGPHCPQPPSALVYVPGVASEDCLSLNVWTPNPAHAKKPLPVMVWFHGGSFVTGGTSVTYYNGSHMAEAGDVVVVSVNSRLGPLGFLAQTDLGPNSGNYGLMDQQAALRWVQDNIAAFGGNPHNVTIFGQSSGSSLVCLHMASPNSAGLFHRAIMESGSCLGYIPPNSAGLVQGDQFAEAIGCSDTADVAACMRSKTPNEVLTALPSSPSLLSSNAKWRPVIDGVTIPESPVDLFEQGAFNKVPVLVGSNKDEGTLFLSATLWGMTETTYQQMVVGMLGMENGQAALALYPASQYAMPGAAFAEMLGDAVFTCPTRETARAVTAKHKAAYLYSFKRTPSFTPSPLWGAFHSAEIPFVFGTVSPFGPLTAEETVLSDAMIGYWTRFAKRGNPNGWGARGWPRYNKLTDISLTLDLDIGIELWAKRGKCNFWKAVPLAL